jgi:hypothetical protein
VKWFRTIRGVAPLLAGLFVIAQLSGVVPSRLAHALPTINAVAMVMHDHHIRPAMDADDHIAKHHHHHDGAAGDECCALHLLVAVLSPVVDAQPADLFSAPIPSARLDVIIGIRSNRLDRPPRPV